MSKNNKIKKLRQARKMSAEKLAEEVGLSQSYVSRIERGERGLESDLLIKMAEVLHCTPNDLLGFDAVTDPRTREDDEFIREAAHSIIEVVEGRGLSPAEAADLVVGFVHELRTGAEFRHPDAVQRAQAFVLDSLAPRRSANQD